MAVSYNKTIPGTDGNDVLNGTDTTNDSISGGAGDDKLYGKKGNDILEGGTGTDTLDGGLGADDLYGEDGNDSYYIDNIGDGITEVELGGTDRVISSINYTLGDYIENLTLSGSARKGVGNDLGNTITGNSYANTLIGNAGNDYLAGLSGNDTIYGYSADDMGDDADILVGGLGNDTYYVGENDQIIESAAQGTDTVITSIDNYTLASNVEKLKIAAGAGEIKVEGNNLANNMTGNSDNEELYGGGGNDVIYGRAGNDSLTGGTGNDKLYGEDGDDILQGDAGSDSMTGGAGNDTYYVDSKYDKIYESAGNDSVISGINYTLASSLENLELSGSATTAVGNASDNSITGNDLANKIDGKTGADYMAGGDGNDTYYIDNDGDVVYENDGEGIDTVLYKKNVTTATEVSIAEYVENLILTGTGSLSVIGNDEDNTIIGNSQQNTMVGGIGNDILDGKVGIDSLVGGLGDDTYIIDNSGDIVNESDGDGNDTVISSVNYTLNDGFENLALSGTSRIGQGNELNNIIVGNAYANVLTGGDGNDRIDGGAGYDSLYGGAGNDLYVIDSTYDKIIGEDPQVADIDTVYSSVSYSLASGLENLLLTGTGNLNGTGNASSNTMVAYDGNNIIDGGTGADYMSGGDGNDTYYVDNIGDIVTDSAGIDTVISTNNYELTDESDIENLTITGTSTTATGNNLNNVITGNDRDNVINGNSGNDSISGAAGNDTIIGGTGADTMAGGTGNDVYYVDNAGDIVKETGILLSEIDTILSSLEAYTLGSNIENLALIEKTIAATAIGNSLANTLEGNLNNNVLDGKAGADTMIGGYGNDTYYVDNAGDIVTEIDEEGARDIVNSSVTFSLGDYIESLTLTGITNIDGTGNELANTIIGNAKNNIINGGAGNDTLLGGAGNDTYVFNTGWGSDMVSDDNSGDNVLDFSAVAATDQNMLVNLYQGESSISYNSNDVSMLNSTFSKIIFANTNTIVSFESDDSGYDHFNADTLVGGTESDNILDFSGFYDGISINLVNGTITNRVYNAAETSLISQTLYISGFDSIIGTEQTDTVTVNRNYTLGTSLDNLVLTDTSNINGTGNELANSITGNSKNNILDGGTGADFLVGGLGNDTYYVDDAEDIVIETSILATEIDTVYSGAETFSLGNNIENLTLLDDEVAITAIGNALANTLIGNDYDNVIDGGAGNDKITAGKGNDSIIGGTGNDLCYYNIGDGEDTILDTAGTDTISFGAGITQDSIYTFRENDDLVIAVGEDEESTDKIYIQNWFTDMSNRGEYLVFTEDQTVLSNLQNYVFGTLGDDDEILGDSSDNIVFMGAGNDNVYGGAGNDTYYYYRGEGADVIDDTAGHDTLILADDITMDDIEISINYSEDDETIPNDLVLNFKDGEGNNDESSQVTIKNFFTTSSLEAVTFEADGVTLTKDYIDAYIEGMKNANIMGTFGNDAIVDTIPGDNTGAGIHDGNNIYSLSGDDTITGGAGSDYIVDPAGNDTYIFSAGDGHDIIQDTSGTDTIILNDVTGYQLRRYGNHLIIQLKEGATLTGDDITISNYFSTSACRVEKIKIGESGTAINLPTDKTTVSTISDFSGNNVLMGSLSGSTITGGTGNDMLIGFTGNDTYTFNLGDGQDFVNDFGGTDKIRFGNGITYDDLQLFRKDNNLIIAYQNDEDNSIAINNFFSDGDANAIELFQFGTANSINFETLVTEAGGLQIIEDGGGEGDIIQGTEEDDTNLIGTIGNDTIYGMTGNDNIIGLAGNDTYIYNTGDGEDILVEYGGTDTLQFGDGIIAYTLDLYSGNDSLMIRVNGSETDSIVISDFFGEATEGQDNQIEFFQFGDDTAISYDDLIEITGQPQTPGGGNDTQPDTINGTTGNDNNLMGTNGDDTIYGWTGDDIITGGNGNDVYIFNRGDGNDTIIETEAVLYDSIQFGDNITQDDLNLTQSGGDLVITFDENENDSITIKNWFDGAQHGGANENLEGLDFTNGIHLGPDDINDLVSGNDTQPGGNDTQPETIYGTAGNDTELTGTEGDDIISGLTGNDNIVGLSGNDTYIYNLEGGTDVLVEFSGTDMLQFGEGITAADLDLYSGNDSLIIKVNGSETNKIIISNFFGEAMEGQDNQIEFFQFGSDTAISYEDLIFITGEPQTPGGGNDTQPGGNDTQPETIYGTTGNDTNLMGSNGDDTISGLAGSDTIIGLSGNDTYMYNVGDGPDCLIDTSGNDMIQFGNGITAETLDLYSNEGNLIISVNGSQTDIITASYFFTQGETDNQIEFFQFGDDALSYSELIAITGEPGTIGGNDTEPGGNDTTGDTLGTSGDDNLMGTDGNESLMGGLGNDTYTPQKGFDYLTDSGDDAEIYNFNSGDGQKIINDNGGIDKIVFGAGILNTDLTFEFLNDELRISIAGETNDQIIIRNAIGGMGSAGPGTIETLEFLEPDQNSMDSSSVNPLNPQYDDLSGNDSNNFIIGTMNYNTINGDPGSDTIFGLGGDDVYYFHAGDGNDVVADNAGNDTLYLYGVTGRDQISFISTENDLQIIYGNDAVTIRDWFNPEVTESGNNIIENIYLPSSSSGCDSLLSNAVDYYFSYDRSLERYDKEMNYGTINDDSITGTEGNDNIDGLIGNDTYDAQQGRDFIMDPYGDDLYKFNRGYEQDIFMDLSGNDTILFGDSIVADDLEFYQYKDHLLIQLKPSGDYTQDKIMLPYYYSTPIPGILYPSIIENVSFNGAAPVSLESLMTTVTPLTSMMGTSGNDVIITGVEDDVIIPMEGNDLIIGGEGNDVYCYNQGGGSDTILDEAGSDIITFGEGITLDDLNFEVVLDESQYYTNDIKISFKNSTTDSIIIQDALNYNETAKIETLLFNYSETFDLSMVVPGTAIDDNLYGTDGSDIMYGLAGNDILYGFEGNDTLIGGIGYDYLSGGDGDDTYSLAGNSGCDIITDTAGNDTIILNSNTVNISQVVLFQDINGNLVMDYGAVTGEQVVSIQAGSSIEAIQLGNYQLDTDDINTIITATTAYNGGNAPDTTVIGAAKADTEFMSTLVAYWNNPIS